MNYSIVRLECRKALLLWLGVCCALVACMVVLGGYTRLSGSGLSITEWKPLHGALPPLNDVQWQEEFANYRATPQYAKVNEGMELPEFKSIYWPEYLHRLLGRVMGLVFFLPLLFFALKRAFTMRFGIRLTGIFALGGLQGAVGWIMVASGLIDQPYVSHLKLALHLGLAFILFALLLWTWLDVAQGGRRITDEGKTFSPRQSSLFLSLYYTWFGLLCLQILYGALMSGLHAGHVYNTWPLMNGEILPAEALQGGAWLQLLLSNIAMVQFIHRSLAILLVLGFIFWWRVARKSSTFFSMKWSVKAVFALLFIQFCLGVCTLLSVVALPLALMHQFTGLALFAASLWLLHRLRHAHV